MSSISDSRPVHRFSFATAILPLPWYHGPQLDSTAMGSPSTLLTTMPDPRPPVFSSTEMPAMSPQANCSVARRFLTSMPPRSAVAVMRSVRYANHPSAAIPTAATMTTSAPRKLSASTKRP